LRGERLRYDAGVLTRRSFVLGSGAALAAAPAKPNIVLILADDLGSGDIRRYFPEARVRTPRMDQLAAEGVRFTDAHSPSSVCTPTRYGLLTGRYCWRTRLKRGVLNGESPSLIEPGRTTLASMLKQQGYRTGGFGKWHLGLGNAEKTDYTQELTPGPLDFGFDEYFGIPASLDMPPYVFVDGRRVQELPTATIRDSGAPLRGAFWRGGPIAPSFRMEDVLPKITARACDFIRKSRPPFFAYVPLAAPHTPWVPSADFRNKSSAGLYGDFVGEVDYSVGRILDAIRAAGAERNTLVILTSDNGAPWSQPDIDASNGHRANAYWRGQKADIFEAGHRVPFIVKWPARAAADQTSAALVCLTDVFATVAESIGRRLKDDEAEDSFSFLGALHGGQGAREAVVHHSANGMFALRQGNLKYIEGLGSGGFTKPQTVEPGPEDPPGCLYDLAADPRETNNLYRQRPDDVARLSALLNTCRSGDRSRPQGSAHP
jgi:arylsulfatase A